MNTTTISKPNLLKIKEQTNFVWEDDREGEKEARVAEHISSTHNAMYEFPPWHFLPSQDQCLVHKLCWMQPSDFWVKF